MKATLTRSGATGYSTANWKSYDVWGGERASTGSGSMFGYCGNLGHPTDPENGLIYMRARFYEPWTGRFLSADPAKVDYNWYTYASSRPSTNGDESGLYSENLGDKLLRNSKDIVIGLSAIHATLKSLFRNMGYSAAAFAIGAAMLTCIVAWAADVFVEGAPLFGGLLASFYSLSAGVPAMAQIDYRRVGNSPALAMNQAKLAWETYMIGLVLFLEVLWLEGAINGVVR